MDYFMPHVGLDALRSTDRPRTWLDRDGILAVHLEVCRHLPHRQGLKPAKDPRPALEMLAPTADLLDALQPRPLCLQAED